MAFESGRVTFCRWKVTGDAPTMVDDTALSILQSFAFKEQDIATPDDVEIGFITSSHLYDTQFSYEKVGYGDTGTLMLFAGRMDTHKVPSEIKRAYQKINEQSAAASSPTGMISKSERRQARETAGRQVQEELSSGKYRKSKIVPLFWDLAGQTIYCGSTSANALEAIARLIRESFAVELDLLTSGILAGSLLRKRGRDRDYEDMHPSAFTRPPDEARQVADDADDTPRDIGMPVVPWVAQSVDLKDFIGNEFLLWLWARCEQEEGEVPLPGGRNSAFVAIDKSLDMDCAWSVRGKQTLRSDRVTQLNEAGEALKTGKWPRKVGLILSDGEYQWELTLQGDRWQIGSAQLPEIVEAQHERQIIQGRLDHTVQLANTLDGMFETFLAERTGGSWQAQREKIGKWITTRR